MPFEVAECKRPGLGRDMSAWQQGLPNTGQGFGVSRVRKYSLSSAVRSGVQSGG